MVINFVNVITSYLSGVEGWRTHNASRFILIQRADPPPADRAILFVQFSYIVLRLTLSKSFSEEKTTAKQVWEMINVESLLFFFLFLK